MAVLSFDEAASDSFGEKMPDRKFAGAAEALRREQTSADISAADDGAPTHAFAPFFGGSHFVTALPFAGAVFSAKRTSFEFPPIEVEKVSHDHARTT